MKGTGNMQRSKTIVATAILTLLAALGVQATTAPAQASFTAYTYLSVPGDTSSIFAIDCHGGQIQGVTGDWISIGPYQNTKTRCGGDGWIDQAWSPVGMKLKVQNWNTGNITVYPCNSKQNVGGGYYWAWTRPC